MDDAAEVAGRTQAQATAAWVDHLNRLRMDSFLAALGQQDVNLEQALASVDDAIKRIDLDVIAANRGGVTGMHGFIAEVAEVGVGNARSQIIGGGSVYRWVNDNGPVDLLRGGVPIQQKFVAAGGRFGLGAIAEHLHRYPDFLEHGGKYQIPRDHFEVIQRLHALPADEAGRVLTRNESGPSLRDWQRVRAFFAENDLSIESLEPSNFRYRDVQLGVHASTLEAETESLLATDQSLRTDAYHRSRPTLGEAAKATVGAAAVEGGSSLVLALIRKRREDKKLNALSSEDWIDIAGDTGLGLARGGVRGLSIYSLTNVTATPATVASGFATAAIGIADQAHRFRGGEIDEREFLVNAELACLGAAVGALSSIVGQALIPLPLLGAIIGNAVGTVMYSAIASSCSRREAQLIERYLDEQRVLDEHLAAAYQGLIDRLGASMSHYLRTLDQAFSPDLEIALRGSAQLAQELGVAPENVLDTEEKVASYFLD